jgi:cytochrome c oxidase subunit 2
MTRSLLFIVTCIVLAGCSGWQSALDPHSTEAGHLADLFWFFLMVCATIWLFVAGSLFLTLRQRRTGGDDVTEDTPPQARRTAVG